MATRRLRLLGASDSAAALPFAHAGEDASGGGSGAANPGGKRAPRTSALAPNPTVLSVVSNRLSAALPPSYRGFSAGRDYKPNAVRLVDTARGNIIASTVKESKVK
ncbi:Pax3- And Pax7-Binding Protein 1 [Manis pentadactyla]|nr:Pax3- And Pax7-Binding Protein 1 [Manis pentadactyla]